MRPSELEVEHRYAQINGIRMHYVEKGSGPLVVLLHGFPEMWWSWRYQIDPLVDAGYRVIAPDLRGYNETDKKGPFDIDTLCADVRALIRHAGEERATLVSHDWGGAIAWHFAATMPEHCDRLVVINCPHPALMKRALLGQWSQMKRSWYMFFFLLPLAPEILLTANNASAIRRTLRSGAVDRSHLDDEEIAPMINAIQRPGAATSMVNYYRTALKRGLRDRSAFATYRIVTAPTLLIWGMDDPALGYDDLVPGTDRWVRSLRELRIPGCGHFVQHEQPEKVNAALLEFLGPPRADRSS